MVKIKRKVSISRKVHKGTLRVKELKLKNRCPFIFSLILFGLVLFKNTPHDSAVHARLNESHPDASPDFCGIYTARIPASVLTAVL